MKLANTTFTFLAGCAWREEDCEMGVGDTYKKLPDSELVRLWREGGLTEDAVEALVVEMNGRGIKFSSQNAAPSEPKHKGVGGWLLFFCLGLTVFTPLVSVVTFVVNYNQASNLFGRFPGMLTVIVIDGLLSLALVAYGFYAGIALWKIRPGAIQAAKRFLLFNLVYAGVSAVIPFMAGLPSAANAAMVPQVIWSMVKILIYCAIWYFYLKRSKRVKATYES